MEGAMMERGKKGHETEKRELYWTGDEDDALQTRINCQHKQQQLQSLHRKEGATWMNT